MQDNFKIASAEQAWRRSKGLRSRWSDETQLTQRLLIYIAELLEQGLRHRKTKHKLTKWQIYATKYLRDGKTIQQAAVAWKKRQPPN